MPIRTVGVVLVLAVAAAGCSGAQPRAVREQARPVATSVPAPPVWLESPQMTSPTTGWTLRLTTWGFSYSELVRTTDGGRTWTDVTPPAAAALLSMPDVLTPVLLARDGEHAWLAICCAGQFPSIQFLSPADGIVMPYVPPGSRVPVVYITVNGGRTWTVVPQGLRVSDPELLGYDYVSTRTWFAWYGNQAQTRAQASTIYETRDSGRTWTAITGRL